MPVYAGGGPQNVLVVVNANSPESVALGNYYREARGIPAFNVLPIDVPIANGINSATFSNQVRNPILAYIADAGLHPQIDYIVFSRDIPYRVSLSGGNNGLTSAMFYDFKDSPPPCSLPTETKSDYFEAETAFTHNGQPSSGRYYISTMLTAWDIDGGLQLVDRSVLADHQAPLASMNFLQSSDMARNVQWPQFDRASFLVRLLPDPVESVVLRANNLNNTTNIMGYMVGVPSVANLTNNTFAAGALAEHLTSFGGFLFDSSQMSILDWIAAGAAGAYGTVTEPCNYTNKFSQARLFYWYGRGFNLGESFYMAVENPYQGVIVGDPLTAPYARPPGVVVHNLTPHQTISGQHAVQIEAFGITPHQRIDRIDLFMNDRYSGTLTNLFPQAGDELTVTVEGDARSYMVNVGDSLEAIATGLANAINTQQPPPPMLTPVTATAVRDRIELRQTALGQPGAHIAYSVAVTNTLTDARVTIQSHSTHLIETERPARRRLTASGTVDVGDELRLIVTTLSGDKVTNVVTAVNGDNAFTMLGKLRTQVNADPALAGTDGCELVNVRALNTEQTSAEVHLVARNATWESYLLHIDYQAVGFFGSYSGAPSSNSDALSARGMLYLFVGATNLVSDIVLDTTQLSDGPHTLRAVAYEGSAVRTQGHAVVPFTVQNHADAHCVITSPGHEATFPVGAMVSVQVDASITAGVVTSVQFYAHGQVRAETNAPPWIFDWDTAETGAGQIDLQAVAYGDSGERIKSPVHTVHTYLDSDGDSLPDWWEYTYFGSVTGAPLDSDPDDLYAEYVAGTDPTDPDDVFKIVTWPHDPDEPTAALSFTSSTSRFYRVEWHDASLIDEAAWQPAAPDYFRGEPATTIWSTTNAPPPEADLRFYRIQVRFPE